MNNKLVKIYELKRELNHRKSPNQGEIKRIKENYIIKNTYNSNAIKGNTLTEMETRFVIETNLAVGKKSLKDHLEIRNYYNALIYIETLTNEILSEENIKTVHAILLDGLDRTNKGKYRTIDTSQEIHTLLSWYTSEPVTINRIIEFICKFINIHSFIDENGRTSRLLTNLELLKLRYPPITVLATDILEYYQALDKSYYGDYEEAYDFFYNRIIESLNGYLNFTK
ncbi:Fic family protein [Cetobacterium somerae]|uniref:Fic family protein n=1 Tax=Cetobacterium sp. NK01 TaxID=2993530 RepID=UPI002116C27C|nr:Fic family protein [Cetobacterium sp. NK01]MCQ8213147.1 Fic family protein [Cetobacterium sp. NK01]